MGLSPVQREKLRQGLNPGRLVPEPSSPHPTQTESPSWRRTRGEKQAEEDKGVSQER